MTRRRLILAACVAVVALAADWWLSRNELSAEERQFVGTWYSVRGNRPPDTIQLLADHSFRQWSSGGSIPAIGNSGYWSVRADTIDFCYESDLIRDRLRPILEFLGINVGPTCFRHPKSIFAVEGKPIDNPVWTRDRGD